VIGGRFVSSWNNICTDGKDAKQSFELYGFIQIKNNLVLNEFMIEHFFIELE
jgi:hypothetical protein